MGLKHSKLSARQHGELLKLFVAGATARTAAELVGVHRNTAALFFRKLRELIAEHQESQMRRAFDGEVEIDESYFGGRRNLLCYSIYPDGGWASIPCITYPTACVWVRTGILAAHNHDRHRDQGDHLGSLLRVHPGLDLAIRHTALHAG